VNEIQELPMILFLADVAAAEGYVAVALACEREMAEHCRFLSDSCQSWMSWQTRNRAS
jgi:hypothetical protein